MPQNKPQHLTSIYQMFIGTGKRQKIKENATAQELHPRNVSDGILGMEEGEPASGDSDEGDEGNELNGDGAGDGEGMDMEGGGRSSEASRNH